VLVAGRPGALEASLREAGVDGFLFVGCDAVATLSDLLEGLS
jgi:methylmalonyl-CoA mutase